MSRPRQAIPLIATAVLGGAQVGTLFAALDWWRIMTRGDVAEPSFLSWLWLTLTATGALAGLVAGLLLSAGLAVVGRRRGRPGFNLPGGYVLPVMMAIGLVGFHLVTPVITPTWEGQAPLAELDQASKASAAGTEPASGGDETPASVILLMLDTVRADHLSLHGYHRQTTPVLEELAEECLVCDSARSTASWTLPAHGSLFTGLYPSQHRLHNYHRDEHTVGLPQLSYPMAANVPTVAMILERAGFQTAAIYANPVISPRFRLDRGFGLYRYENNRNEELDLFCEPLLAVAPGSGRLETFRKTVTSARQINRRVTHWLDNHARAPFFLFVNYMDAHWPYRPPEPFDELFPASGTTDLGQEELREIILGGERPLTETELSDLHARYDGEIAYLDSQLRELIEHLRDSGLWDSSLVIVTSDHGEFFGEHDLVFHGRELYEAGVKIPLMVKYPGGEPRGRHGEPVGLEDIVPTILDVVGRPIPKRMGGVPIGAARTAPTVAENHFGFKIDFKDTGWGHRFDRVRRSMVEGNHKFIHSSDGRHELYDLEADPDERDNLLDRDPALAEPFLQMAADLEAAATRPRSARDLMLSEEQNAAREKDLREKLAELGYVEGKSP
jgi:arylsulfatase A-like enzyme